METGNFCYRLLHENNNPRRTLRPKNPFSYESVEDHVRIGSRAGFQSKYISTCRTYSSVRKLLSLKTKGDLMNVQIVKIDLNQLAASNVIDLTNATNRSQYLRSNRAKYLAINFDEVLIRGSIPRSAFKIIYAGSKYDCPYIEPKTRPLSHSLVIIHESSVNTEEVIKREPMLSCEGNNSESELRNSEHNSDSLEINLEHTIDFQPYESSRIYNADNENEYPKQSFRSKCCCCIC